jgi:hypothetical protein
MRVYGLPSCTLFVERTLGHAVAAPAMKGILSGIIQTVGSFGFVAESTGAFTAVFLAKLPSPQELLRASIYPSR